MVNENNRKVTITQLENMDSLTAKHGIKLLCSWVDYPMHVVYNIYETPNMEAFINLNMEPEMMAWLGFNLVETKVVQSRQDARAMLNIK